MEDFYPLTFDDLPSFSLRVKECLTVRDLFRTEGNVALFLLPLTIDLLKTDKAREFKKRIQARYNRNSPYGNGEVSDGFLELVTAFLEENNGTVNLLEITEALLLNDNAAIAERLGLPFLIKYSLPASSGDDNANVYSLSREFLRAQNIHVAAIPSMEQALQNSVILEDVFKKLRISDQKKFRLVSSTWAKETFPFWRKNSTIIIHVLNREANTNNGILLSLFMSSFEGNGILVGKPLKPTPCANNDLTVKGNDKNCGLTLDSSNYKLKQRPFHSYKISYWDSQTKKKATPFLCGEEEAKFWQVCGSFVKDLEINYACFIDDVKDSKSLPKICERILLETCPTLEILTISCSSSFKKVPENPSGLGERQNKNENFVRKQEFAENLHTLRIDADYILTMNKDLRDVLYICPNLKTLILIEEGDVSFLLNPTANGELIKLEKLALNYCNSDAATGSFFLRKYTEMLLKNNYNPLQHLHLTGLTLHDLRSSPFNFYAAIALSSPGLKTLVLQAMQPEAEEDKGRSWFWFTDLSPFLFPNLTEFYLSLELSWFAGPFLDSKFQVKFDFGTLKGMPNLLKLGINVKITDANFIRRSGVRDWIFKGNRTVYLPRGIPSGYRYSAKDPILCNNLKEFSFMGWALTEEDIPLLSGWFPNLKGLNAEVAPENLLPLLENWKSLTKLEIQTEKFISLRQLRPLREKRNDLQVFQTIFQEGSILLSLELMENNGRIYFDEY